MDYGTYTYTYNVEGMSALGMGLGALAGFLSVMLIILGIMQIFVVVGRATTLRKLGQHWWAAIIPFWSDYEMCCGARMDQTLRIVIPVVGLAVPVLSALDLNEVAFIFALAFYVLNWVEAYHVAKAFEYGVGFMFGLMLLPFVFWMIIGLNADKPFGDHGVIKSEPALSSADADEAEANPITNADGSRRNFG